MPNLLFNQPVNTIFRPKTIDNYFYRLMAGGKVLNKFIVIAGKIALCCFTFYYLRLLFLRNHPLSFE